MATSVTKKNSLCRYFIRYGDCFHGENCQYIHAYPPQSSPPHQQPASTDVSSIANVQAQNAAQQSIVNQQQQQQLQLQQQQQQQQQRQQPQQQGYNMNKLICSFKSELPNEIDFAMQVATLLANTDNFTWTKDYLVVDAICSSLHVFICVCGDISNCYCYPKFWHKIMRENFNNIYLQAATLPPDMEQSYMNFMSLENHELKEHNKIYRRIRTAAELVKQFSMTTDISRNDKNDQNLEYNYHQIRKKKLKASPPLLKFVSLLFHCDDKPLNLIGLDILSNTASKLSKIPDTTDDVVCTKLVQMFQDKCVEYISRQDGDIYVINRSIEVVSRLISSSSKSVTSHIINLISEKNLVLRVEQFLTSHYDVTLFLSALEFCYRISRHQPHLLTAGRARYLMKILVNLLNCDDTRYFTQNALKRIKLVDEQPSNNGRIIPILPANVSDLENASANRTTTALVPSVPVVAPTIPPSNPTAIPTPATKPSTTSSSSPTLATVPTTATEVISSAAVPTTTTPTTVASETASTITESSVVTVPTTTVSEVNPTTNSTTTTISTTNPTLTPTPTTTSTAATSPVAITSTIPTPVVPTTPVTTIQMPTTSTTASTMKEYLCEWDGCNQKFTDPKQVYTHVFDKHIGPLPADTLSSCLWSTPDGTGPGCVTKRPKFSLLTHLNDFHCNRTAPVKPPVHPGYAPNAALLAIKRHANSRKDLVNGSKNLHNQSPLSISVRLTAALILRNLATESPDMKQALESHEPLLSEICMSSGRDEAKIIAECLSLFSSD